MIGVGDGIGTRGGGSHFAFASAVAEAVVGPALRLVGSPWSDDTGGGGSAGSQATERIVPVDPSADDIVDHARDVAVGSVGQRKMIVGDARIDAEDGSRSGGSES